MKLTLQAAGPAVPNTLEEERREVLDSVFHALCRHESDPDEMAACAYLVRHLAGKEKLEVRS
jgi:hypothetical protein